MRSVLISILLFYWEVRIDYTEAAATIVRYIRTSYLELMSGHQTPRLKEFFFLMRLPIADD